MIFKHLAELRDRHRFVPKNVLDVGANLGNFSLRCKQELWPVLTNFFLVEANEECRYYLSSTGFPYFLNVLGETDGKEVIFYKTKDAIACTGNSVYKEKTVHYTPGHVIEEKRKMITLDTLFKDKGVKFDFAKLDTQGSELDILKGGVKTLSTCKFILMEVSLKYYNDGVPLKDDIIKYMADFGYTKFDIVEEHIWEQIEPVGDIHMGDLFQQDLLFYKDV